MSSAEVPVVGALLPPPLKGRSFPSDNLHGQLLAYGAGSSISITQTQPLCRVCVLSCPSSAATVTAVKWAPAGHGRATTAGGPLRLAAGDMDGSVVVWDVHAAAPYASLADCGPAQQVIRDYLRVTAQAVTPVSLDARDSSSGGPHTSGGAAAAAASFGSISSLGWLSAGDKPPQLAVLMAPSLLLVWDVLGTGGLVYSCDLLTAVPAPTAAASSSATGGQPPAAAGSTTECFHAMSVDPWQPQRVCCCSTTGSVLVALLSPATMSDRAVTWRHMRAHPSGGGPSNSSSSSSPAAALQPTFVATRHLLVLLLPRELLVADLELGTVPSRTPLHDSMSKSPFYQVVGVYGRGTCLGLGDEGGLDGLAAAHADGHLTTWVRAKGELRMRFAGKVRLVPPPLKSLPQASLAAVQGWVQYSSVGAAAPTSSTSSSSGSSQLVTPKAAAAAAAAAAGMGAGGRGTAGLTATDLEDLTKKLKRCLLPDTGGKPARGSTAAAGGGSGPTSASSSGTGVGPGATAAAAVATLHATTLTSDGRLWLWRIPLPPLPLAAATGPSAGPASAAPALPTAAAASSSSNSMPSGSPAAAAAAAAAAHKQQPAEPLLPALQQVVPGLPGAVTSLCWCSQAVAVVAPAGTLTAGGGESRAPSPSVAGGAEDYTSSSSSRSTAVLQGQLLLLAAAGTTSGHVLVWSAARGGINPVEWQLQRSFLTHPGESVKAVKWLGRTPWVVSCSTSKVPGRGVRNALVVTNILTGHSYPFRSHVSSEGAAVAMLRASPTGAYLVLMFKGQPAELWAMPQQHSSSSSMAATAGGALGASPPAGEAGGQAAGGRDTFVPPYRLRLIDLSFTALEWAASEGHPQQHPHQQQQDALTYWLPDGTTVSTGSAAQQQQPTTPTGAAAAAAAAAGGNTPVGGGAGASGSAGSSDAQPAAPAPAGGGEFAHMPLEQLVYSLADGRSGTLTVRGRVVKDAQPNRPSSGPGPHDILGTAAAATGSLVFLGDSEGQLLAWDTASGRCSRLSTGQGLIRRVLAVVGTATTAAAAGALLTSAPASAAASAPRRSFMSGGSATNSSSNVAGAAAAAAAASAGGSPGAGANGSSPNGSAHGGNAATVWIRLAVLFAKGTVGVYDVDGLGRLRPSLAQPAAIASSVGRVTDLGWVPVPGSIGAGTLLSVVTEEGGLAVLDVSAPPAAPAPTPAAAGKPPLPAPAAGGSSSAQAAYRRRLHALRKRLLETSWSLVPVELQQQQQQQLQQGASQSVAGTPAGGGGGEQQHPRWMQAQLVAPPPPSCGLLLPPTQQQLVRLLLQLGTSLGALHKLSLAPGAGDQEVLDELLQLLPPAAAAAAGGSGAGGEGGSPASISSSPSAQEALETEQHQLQQRSEGLGGLVSVLRSAAAARGTGGLLLPEELAAYCNALSNSSSSSSGSSSIADRMAAAAAVTGAPVEARFWQLLPASLKQVKELQEVIATAAAAVAVKKAAQLAAAAAAPPLPHIKTSSSANNVTSAPSGSSSMVPAGSQPPPAVAAVAASDKAESTTPTAAAIDAAVAAFAACQAASDGAAAGAAAEGQQESSEDPDALDADDYERLVQGAVGQAVPIGGTKPGGSSAKGPGEHHHHHQHQQRRGAVLPGHVKATGAGGRGLPGVVAPPLAAHRRLWESALAVQECQERLAWHEAMPPSSSSLHSSSSGSLIVPFAAAFAHQYQIRELRLLEYVVLADYAAAVAVLLAEPPEHSMRWYRGVVCALSLAAAASVTTAGHPAQASLGAAAATALQLQAAKVVSAHAVGLGDMALGVHLNCSAGNFAEAAAVLQEAGLWRLAAALAAARLTGTEASVVLSRWAAAAAAVDGGEGLWRAVGLWTAAGCLRSAATALLDAGLPDAAHAYVAACQQAGLLLPPAGGGGVTPSSSSSNLSAAAGASAAPRPAGEQQQVAGVGAGGAGSWGHTKPLVWSWAHGWHQAVTEGVTEGVTPTVAPVPVATPAADGGLQTIRRISGAGKGLAGQDDLPLLFDMLGHRSSAPPAAGNGGAGGQATAAPGGGQGLLQRVHTKYEGWVRQLVSAATSASG